MEILGFKATRENPLTLFVPLSSLQKKLFRSLDEVSGSTQFANFILLGTQGYGEIDHEDAELALDQSWTLEDAGIEIKELRETEVERSNASGFSVWRSGGTGQESGRG